MPKYLAKHGTPSQVYHWYRRVGKYTPYASFVSTLMHFEGFKSPRIASVKDWHYAREGKSS